MDGREMKGHVRERPPGSGNWYAVIETRDPSTGRRKRKWISLHDTVKRKGQAEGECSRILTEMKGGTYVDPSKLTLAVFLDRWLNASRPNVAPKTFERYAEICRKNLVPLLGGVHLTQLK